MGTEKNAVRPIMAPPSAAETDLGATEDATEDATTAKHECSRPRPPSPTAIPPNVLSCPDEEIVKQITKGVLRAKLSKRRHLVLPRAVSPAYLDELMPPIVNHLFEPQTVTYNGGVANVTQWKISCYLEVMEGGVPCTNPHEGLRAHCGELLDACDALFARWYRQQHACNGRRAGASSDFERDGNGDPIVSRLMTFVTRYTPAPDECALLKHVDGAGKVDGSVVLALPVDRWTGGGEEENSFEGHGGGLTFWDGGTRRDGRREPEEIAYDTRSGDLAFIDRAVWHQANPITKGTRWALVIFYKVKR